MFLSIKIVFFGRQRVFLENCVGGLRLGAFLSTKIVFFDSQGVFCVFLEKKRVWMAGVRISRKKSVSGWLICVFLEKKACLDGRFAYFSRKKRVWMAGSPNNF